MNGFEALEKLSHNEYDLVFVDIEMPKMNGLELMQEIKRIGRRDSLKVIAATGHVMPHHIAEYKVFGFNEIMS